MTSFLSHYVLGGLGRQGLTQKLPMSLFLNCTSAAINFTDQVSSLLFMSMCLPLKLHYNVNSKSSNII